MSRKPADVNRARSINDMVKHLKQCHEQIETSTIEHDIIRQTNKNKQEQLHKRELQLHALRRQREQILTPS